MAHRIGLKFDKLMQNLVVLYVRQHLSITCIYEQKYAEIFFNVNAEEGKIHAVK